MYSFGLLLRGTLQCRGIKGKDETGYGFHTEMKILVQQGHVETSAFVTLLANNNMEFQGV